MIQEVINTIKANITALPFVERFGGLVQVMEKYDQGEADQPKVSRYPVSFNVTARDCWEKGLYLHLVPNSNYKSVFYFEELEGLSLVRDDKNETTFRGTVRLVAWLNFVKLGWTDYPRTGAVSFECLSALSGKYQPTSGILDGAAIKITALGQARKSPDIFADYTYGSETIKFLMYPYDYFALDFNISLTINKNCAPVNIPDEDLSCLDLTINPYVPPAGAARIGIGEMKLFAGTTIPSNWSACDGSTLLIATYPLLFAVVGTSFGGDGVTDFKLPDLRGRAPIGTGTGAGLTTRAIGDEIGAETHQLSEGELPSHNHPNSTPIVGNNPPNQNDPDGYELSSFLFTDEFMNVKTLVIPSTSIGFDEPHNNMQPSLSINYIIRISL